MSNDNEIGPDSSSSDFTGQTENPREEARLAAVLRRIEADAPAVDADQLRTLRERSLSAFAERAAVAKSTDEPREQETPAHPVIPITVPNIARRPMRERSLRSLAFRGGAALLATAAAILLAWSFWPTNSIGAPTFAKVIAGLRQAETLELRVIKPQQSAEVWVRAPGLVRWQETPERYRISAGSRLWKIDETANTVTTGDSSWFVNPQEQVDLLALLELGVSDATPLLKSKPSEEREYARRPCLVYSAVIPAADQTLLIEAFTDVETGQFAGIIARRQGERASAPPLAELQLVAINPAVDESRFIVAKSLTEDGRIGDVSDAQGIVVLRPMLAQRWTPVCRETSLKPGDWLRTDRRGANAVRVRFSSDVELTLGPGTLVECVSPTQARLHSGEAQVALAAGVVRAFDLLAPRSGAQQVAAGTKQLWRVGGDEKLVEVKQPPRWLGGFEGTTNNESLGSLIVHLPDGRNEPLSVGYHKVNVEIRDQIARTTIEESFVNHTNARLEGVFHFPLPQDASISGFGMWIGNELVEADVVEKQRAREIFETILRENRDPGLLEWTSGNLFKARVFPIEAHSEKRVKIVYTQVLPLRANRYRYTYGLRSDLLRTRPVRELDLTVTVQSARELRTVSCPTHSARHEQTPHAARVEFTAQDYTPDRDFEVVCEVDGRAADVIAIPHSRGSDGYFLLQISPPAREGNLKREILPDGQPLDLVLLCDTSASMDTEKRRQQSEFVATVLASLSEKDRFLLCAADVEPNWASAEPQRATAENIAKAQTFLDERISLGWTDLDRAFAGVLEKAPTGAQVIYLGDGIVTTGDADPVAFVRRLQQLAAKANPPGQPRTRWLSAVTVGNASESIVLNGIAAAGGGSVRAISGERTPQLVALELLSEIAEPGLRELQIEFRGVQVAAVYPERLPNVAAGAQQIVVGRYLPGVKPQPGPHQQGEIIVSGLLGNEPVRYAAKLDLVEAEAGNSFIPRLWARGHLDHLLRQGSSPAIRDEIIELSEEFHIITPYTSLLVLESDADRERFGVQRRFEMRDGERFFAEGKADATFALRQAQSKRAGDWRLGLRRQALAELAALGRTIPWRNSSANRGSVWSLHKNEWYSKGKININTLHDSNLWGEISRGSIRPFTNYLSLAIDTEDPRSKSLGDLDNQTVFDSFEGQKSPRELAYTIAKPIWETDGDGDDALNFNLPDIERSQAQTGRLMLGVGVNSNSGLVGFAMSGEQAIGRFSVPGGINEDYDPVDFQNLALSMTGFDGADKLQPRIIIQEEEEIELTGGDFPGQQGQGMGGMGGGAGASWGAGGFGAYPAQNGTDWGWDVTVGLSGPGVFSADLDVPFGDGTSDYAADQGYFEYDSLASGWPKLRTRVDRARPGDWLNAIAPVLSPPAGRETPPKDSPRWSPEALALAKSLLRAESLARMNGGIELRRTVTSIDPVWNRRSTRPAELVLYSPGAWLTRSLDASQECVVNFCDVNDRGVYSRTTSLGRIRRAFQRDLLSPPLSISDDSLHSLAVAYAAYVARVVPGAAGQASMILTDKESGQEVRLLIEVERHVVLRRETFADGRSQGAITNSDFVEIAGSWWARRQTRTDERDRVVYETTLDLKPLSPEPFAARLKEELAGRAQAYLMRLPLVKLDIARQHRADGSADFDDDLRLLLEACRTQQWDEALAQLDAIEKLSADRPGVRWMRTFLLKAMRRNEEARQRLLEDARALAASPAIDDIPRATLILRQLGDLTSPAEQLEFVELLKPVFDRQPAEWDMKSQWRREALHIYRQSDRNGQVTAILLAQSKEDPSDTQAQVDYANHLAEHGNFDAAYAWLQTELDRPVEREPWDDSRLREAYAALYKRQGRWADWLRFSTAWIERKPVEGSPYSEHLTALVYNDRIADADRLAEGWLAEARSEGPLTVDCRARLAAAVSYALGEGHWRRWPAERAERWAGPLAEAAKHLVNAKSRTDFRVTQNIVQDPFTRSEACERLRGYALARLQADVADLSPAQITLLLQWATQGQIMLAAPVAGRTQFSAGEIPDEAWQGIAAKLRERWRQTPDMDVRRHLGEALRTIHGSHFGAESLPFYREQLAAANDDEKPGYFNELYQALFNHQWSETIEAEAFELLPRLNAQLPPIDRLAADAQALASLDERMLAGRQTIAEQALQDQGKTNELTGVELQAKRAAAILASRQALASRLRDMEEKEQTALRPWLQIEWTLLQMQMGENRAEVAEICWQMLGEAPRSSALDIKHLAARLEPKQVAGKAAEEPDWEPLRHALQTRSLENQLRRRTLTTVMNLAARRDAAPADVARVSRYIDAGVALDASEAQAWRAVKFQWLIVLDKPDELERQLRDWIRADASLSRWRKPLALLLAERGRLDEAVQLFETAQKDNLLTATDYNTLA
ncbi:MAG TPA: VIT domain-containing protein, partial [Pirellulales bacterium]